MNGQGFINKLLEDMAEDKKRMPEISMPKLAQILFNGKPVKEYDLIKQLLSFREKYQLDYIVALPISGKPPMVRFWKTKKTNELPEVLDGHDND